MPQKIPEDNHYRLLRVLEDRPAASQREIAEKLTISLGAVNYCLKALVEKGQVKVRNFRAADNRMRYAYVLTPKGIAEKTRLTRRFLGRKLAEYEALKSEIEALSAEIAQQDGDRPGQGDAPGTGPQTSPAAQAAAAPKLADTD